MYEFIDTTGTPAAGTLPVEAMSINGQYIEDLIEGYRTLTVSGRELLGTSIDNYTIGNTPGAYFRGSKLPTRTITVKYQLFADDAEDFRDKFNQLNAILNVEQAQIIFADETDKYFVGTRANVGAVPAGVNNVTGTFEIICSDPCKYAVEEKTFTASANNDGILETTIENAGTVPVPIDYEITTNSQNGFYGIVSAKGVMQYGYAGEIDTDESIIPSKLLYSASNGAVLLWPPGGDTTYLDDWDSNVAIDQIPNEGLTATLATSASQPGDQSTKYKGKNVALISNRGSGSASFRAGNIVYTMAAYTPEGALAPVSDFKNFKAVGHCWFENTINSAGIVTFGVLDSDDNLMACLRLIKESSGTTKGKAYYWIPGKANKTISFDLSSKGAASRAVEGKYGADLQIVKEGEKFTLTFHDTSWTISVPDLSDVGAKKMFFALGTYITADNPPILCFIDAKFTANNVEYEYDVPNRYNEGDVLDIIGSEAKAYINGAPCLDDEIIGTEYFKADPGDNIVQYAYSDWCATAPTIKAKIREAWL